MSQTRYKPRKIEEQVMVITGATSGIGRATALMAAEKGAKVVLAARTEDDLLELKDEITKKGGEVLVVATDVSKESDLQHLREKALEKFGRIDTWINNAGTSIYGYLIETDFESERNLFETNFWGARIGSQLAVECMKDEGGVIINLGSEVSVAAQPLMGMYSASKHALKAFTDALRSELRDKGIPIEVCLVRPTAIDTPFAEHATDKFSEGEPSLPPPMYKPEVAAEAILKCAVTPQRDVYVGGPARMSAILDTFFPQIKDMVAETRMKDLKKGTDGSGENRVHGANEGTVFKRSLYTDITTLNVFKTLKDNFKSSLKDFRKESH